MRTDPAPLAESPPGWRPTPELVSALARLLLALAERDREPAAPPAAAKGGAR
jgi:hypothetical protein